VILTASVIFFIVVVVNECLATPGVCGGNTTCMANETDGSAKCLCLEKFVNVSPEKTKGLNCGTIGDLRIPFGPLMMMTVNFGSGERVHVSSDVALRPQCYKLQA